MLRFLYLLFSISLYSIFNPVTAQNSIEDKNIYGLNPILHNGEVYNYFPSPDVKGHQYYNQKNFTEGCISIRGVKYEKVLINYDILNQEVILKYTDPQGSNRLLKVSKAWLEEFKVSGEHFSLIESPEGEKLIVQTLNQGEMQLHKHWTKKLIAVISFVEEHYVFEKKRSKLLVSYKNKLQEFKSTKDILGFFDDKTQKQIKSYLKENKIKARSNSTEQLIELLNFCNQLSL
jgi:hypothetical protein